MSFTYRYRKFIIIVFLLLTITSSGIFYLYKNGTKKRKTKDNILSIGENKDTKKIIKTKKEEDNYYKVDIKGEVISPGIYTLKEGSRISDVILMAGGLTEVGDTTVINLSKKIKDEMVIVIYSKYQVSSFSETKALEKQVIDKCKNGGNIPNDGCIEKNDAVTSNSSEDGLESKIVSLNNATKEEFMTLPGIGESKADNIIKYRNDHGGFTEIDELKDIKGIGESIFDKIKENITL